MGTLRGWTGWRTVAVLLVAVVAVATAAVAVLRPDEQEKFRAFLLDQPDIVSVRVEDHALAAGPTGGPQAVRAFRPSLEAVVARPLDVAVVGRLVGAVDRYAAAHRSAHGLTVRLRHARDAVLLAADPRSNATTLTMVTAMRALPAVQAVSADRAAAGPPFRATLAAGGDLTAAARRLAAALPADPAAWIGAVPTASVVDPVGHEVQVAHGSDVRATDAAALRVAVETDPDHALVLWVGAPRPDQPHRSVIRVLPTPGAEAVVAALHRSGYGLASLGERVDGPAGTGAMDERGWAAAAAAALERQPGVVRASVDVGSVEAGRPVVADLRVEPQASFDAVLDALPLQVGRLEAHTSEAAPDYARDDSLAPDPEVDCPAGSGSLNLAYSGPRDRLAKASSYLAALRARAAGATCLHWAEAGDHGRRPTRQTVLVRLPLRGSSWRPVLDVVWARRADLGSAHPSVVLLLPVPGTGVTGLFTLAEGSPPYISSLDAGSTAQRRAAQRALEPLVRYWAQG